MDRWPESDETLPASPHLLARAAAALASTVFMDLPSIAPRMGALGWRSLVAICDGRMGRCTTHWRPGPETERFDLVYEIVTSPLSPDN